jgi:hypothetical protein
MGILSDLFGCKTGDLKNFTCLIEIQPRASWMELGGIAIAQDCRGKSIGSFS